MTTSQLIPVSMGHIGNVPTLVVDGRTLHTVLEVKRDFSSWMKARVQKYGFVEGQDYEKIINDFSSPKLGNAPANGLPPIDYTLTLDMGKELCMVENNEKGRLTRRYFIECERRALAEAPAPSLPALSTAPITPEQQCTLQNMVRVLVDNGGIYANIWSRFNNHFRLGSYKQLPQNRMGEAVAYLMNLDTSPKPKPKSIPIVTFEQQLEPHFAGIKAHRSAMYDHEREIINILHRALCCTHHDTPQRSAMMQMNYAVGDLWHVINHAFSAVEAQAKSMCLMARM